MIRLMDAARGAPRFLSEANMGKSKPYNGHKNWNHWNVALWINNDEGLYRMAQSYVREIHTRWGTRKSAAEAMLNALIDDYDMPKTPDGAPFSRSSILAAMRDM